MRYIIAIMVEDGRGKPTESEAGFSMEILPVLPIEKGSGRLKKRLLAILTCGFIGGMTILGGIYGNYLTEQLHTQPVPLHSRLWDVFLFGAFSAETAAGSLVAALAWRKG